MLLVVGSNTVFGINTIGFKSYPSLRFRISDPSIALAIDILANIFHFATNLEFRISAPPPIVLGIDILTNIFLFATNPGFKITYFPIVLAIDILAHIFLFGTNQVAEFLTPL